MSSSAPDRQSLRRVAVVGAGITGLAAAHRLITRLDRVNVDILEAASRPGGIIRTEIRDGFLIEHGPDAFITNNPSAVTLCEELGILDQLIGTSEQRRRSLVVRNGMPLPVPDGFLLMAPSRPSTILTTPILSIRGRLRLLAEAFRPRRKTDDDESLASFVRRRFGSETLDRLVQPLIGGIYTADPEKLSLKATLPRFLEMERTHGSVIRATLAGADLESAAAQPVSTSGARYDLFATLRDGLESLVRRLVQFLEETGRARLLTRTPVIDIHRQETQSGWQLQIESGSSGERPPGAYDGIILATPAFTSAELLATVGDNLLSDGLRSIEYASTAIIVSGHQLDAFEHPLDAFGVVVPAVEKRNLLAVSFASRKFAGRAPEGRVLLRSFVGGAIQPELLHHSDAELIRIVEFELRQLLGMKSAPEFATVHRYHRAMPQYHVGHLDRVKSIEARVSAIPRLELAGTGFRGVGIPDCISSGQAAADRLADSAD